MQLNARQRKALDLLKADSRRDIYQTCHFFDYGITYTGDEKYDLLSREDVDGLLATGLLVPKWPNDPKVQCWVLTPN